MSEPLVLTDSADPAAHAAPEFAILAAVDRATAELRRGALVVLADAGAAGGALVLAAMYLVELAPRRPDTATVLQAEAAHHEV
jgi:hypothetical protein